ncbi:xylose isomerase [Thermosporothrix hazakensis]|jgi:xylose isomerase|uniref:Xylose isomerase n=2 Tax=Thermosporothrix TaxID=768650 RepID=A0A326UAY5_THEHA|nr:xylose isomerase [Thermosporothrix hazakensis]PZW32838.1 xylose isomerase [Thermosporothrix hazakensis]BBH90819.1 xylose isomerase [Thermosporothrix sp. COM3]GCE48869.1 xylose isomerase [Thermosporothrix hazakensis]
MVSSHTEVTSDQYKPRKEDRFSFGLWTVGNRGRDPFGDFVRPELAPVKTVQKLAELGAWGVSFHDNDLVPFGASAQERDRIVREFKKALADNDMVVPMATTNLFFHPIFKDGAFTAVDPAVRAFALQKTMAAIDLGAEVGAKTYVFWGGREGVDAEASKDPVESVKRMREALNFLIQYVKDQGYEMRFALEPKPNEPRSDTYLPTIGHMLAFINTLDDPSMVGVNPEVAHEHMAGLNFVHGVAQALDAGKLFHIDLNDQKGPRYDQDFRFGSENIKSMFFLVKLLEEKGYTGARHFDAHAYRTEDEQGVWDFALGCMRTYNMLKEKVRRFNADPEIKALLQQLHGGDQTYGGLLGEYSKEKAQKLKGTQFDVDVLANRGYQYEKLDQLTIEILLGTR